MTDVVAFAEKVGGELVAGRVIGVVGGKRVYLTGVGEKGEVFLTEEGLLAQDALDAAPAPAPAPKAKRAKKETVADDPVQLELDL